MSMTSPIRDQMLNLGTLDASGANAVVFAPGRPAIVRKIVTVTTIAQTTADAVITMAVRDVDDGNSTTQGTFTLPFTGSAADDVKFVKPGQPSATGATAVDGSTVYEGFTPGGGIRVEVGQELSLTSNGGGDAGTYQVYVEYIDEGFNEADGTELTFTAA